MARSYLAGISFLTFQFQVIYSSNGFPVQGFSRFCSAVVAEVASFACEGFPTAEDAVFPVDFGDTSPCVPGAIIEICSALHSLYPAGDGSIVIFASMPANSWRVR